MLLLSVIAKFVILWTVLSAIISTLIGTGWAVFGKLKRGETVNVRVVATIFAMSFAVNAVLPILQNVATLVAIHRNLKAKLAAWSFKRQYPNVTRGDFSNLAQGAL